jgi:hypothetical protein
MTNTTAQSPRPRRGALVATLGLVLVTAAQIACKRSPATLPEGPAGSIAEPRQASGPSFKRDISPMLAMKCAGTDGCHGPDATDRVNLDLREGGAYRTLVGRPAELRPGTLLVDPGQPDKSFLIAKVTHKLGEGEGKPMPLDPQTGSVMIPSPIADFVERKLVPWIANGAKDD